MCGVRGDELFDALGGGHVDGQRDALSEPERRQLLGGLVAGRGLAGGDIDAGTLPQQPSAIILPMPREPPVTSAAAFEENSVVVSMGFPSGRAKRRESVR